MAAVVLSAALHAIWNYLLRRAGGSRTVAALSIVVEAVFLLPLALVVLFSSGGGTPVLRFLGAITVAAALALANYAALMTAYRGADLSLAYPVARGGVFLFLPLLGFVVFGERIDGRGWFALGLIVGGIMLLPLARFDRPATVISESPDLVTRCEAELAAESATRDRVRMGRDRVDATGESRRSPERQRDWEQEREQRVHGEAYQRGPDLVQENVRAHRRDHEPRDRAVSARHGRGGREELACLIAYERAHTTLSR